jgi:F-type H+-transporting ATPase subunit epsilon
MAQLTCIVVTPEETTLDEQTDFVALPLYDGEIGISPGHSPLIGRLGFGEMRIRIGGTVRRFYVDGGFVQVNGNVVSVLTNRAVAAGSLDVGEAAAQLDAADKQPSNSPELADTRDRALSQARGQLRVAKRGSS